MDRMGAGVHCYGAAYKQPPISPSFLLSKGLVMNYGEGGGGGGLQNGKSVGQKLVVPPPLKTG